jgi:DNA polymerase-4
MDKVIFLIDMNAYFASIEQVCNPALRGKPIVVSGRGYPATYLNKSSSTSGTSDFGTHKGLRPEGDDTHGSTVLPTRTVITTASYEARKYGVKTAMNLPEALKLCPELIVVCGDLDKYVDTSLRIHKILLEFTDQVEVVSIDECYMDVTYLCKAGKDPIKIAKEVKRRIKEETGLLCSVGIGPNKTVAKIVAKLQKPDGLVRITSAEIPGFFENFPVEELQGVGVGPKISEKLKSIGINTAGELGDAPLDKLTCCFGVYGYHLKNIGLGIGGSAVKKYSEIDEIKSVGHTYTLPKDISNIDMIKSYLRMLSEKTGRRLREKNLTGKVISIAVRYGDFFTFSRQKCLKHYIKTGYDIYFNAFRIFETLLPLQKAVRLLGVSISELAVDHGQRFLVEDMERQEKLTDVMDDINKKYGEFTIKPVSILSAENFGIYKKIGVLESRFKISR